MARSLSTYNRTLVIKLLEPVDAAPASHLARNGRVEVHRSRVIVRQRLARRH